MTFYLDTGVLLKLYTHEPESAWVESFVRRRKEPLPITDLHLAEIVSAMRLKVFRKECQEEQATAALDLVRDDLQAGVLRLLEVPWADIWHECRLLSDHYASSLGVRTLDTLHVAIARHHEAREFLTSDTRQKKLARRLGIKVISPLPKRRK